MWGVMCVTDATTGVFRFYWGPQMSRRREERRKTVQSRPFIIFPAKGAISLYMDKTCAPDSSRNSML